MPPRNDACVSAAQAGLTAINEALLCLDRDCVGPHAADYIIVDVVDMLLEARALLTALPFPQTAAFTTEELNTWLSAKVAEQKAAGQQ